MRKADREPPVKPAMPPGLEHLLPRFLEEIAKDINVLQGLAAAGEAAPLADLAHAVRGKCVMFGEDVVAALMAELEASAAVADADEIEHLLKRTVARAVLLGVYDTP